MRYATHQPDRQYARLDRAVLPLPRHGLMPHLGIAVATTLGGWLNAGLLYRTLAKRGYFVADARAEARAAAASCWPAPSWAPCCGSWRPRWTPWFEPRRRSWCALGALAVLIGSGLLVYAVAVFCAPARSICASCALPQPPHAAARTARTPCAALRCARRRAINPRRSRKESPMAFKAARLFGHAADRQPAPRQLPRRHGAAGSSCRRRTSASIASSTCTRSRCGRTPPS